MKTKKSLKERQIEVLTSNVEKWNRYMKYCRSRKYDFKADLSYSNLRGSNLRGSDLSYSDLRGSDLSYSNLRGSDLSYSDLRGSDLRGSDLSYSNLDYSMLHFSCKSLRMKTDTRQRKQIAYHLASLFVHSADVLTDEEKQLLEAMKPFANQFHRVDECGKL